MKDLKDMTVGELRSRTSEQTGIGMELLKCREGFDELARRLAEAERKLAEAVNILRLILPMAKGYAAANRVGSNGEFILLAERFIEHPAIEAQNRDD